MSKPRDPSSIGAALEALLVTLHPHAPTARAGGDALALLWNAAAGPFLARHSRPLGFSRGVLRIGADTSALQGELLRMEQALLTRLNGPGQIEVSRLQVDRIAPFERPSLVSPPVPTPVASISLDDSEDLPPVREELRPILHRILALQRLRRAGR